MTSTRLPNGTLPLNDVAAAQAILLNADWRSAVPLLGLDTTNTSWVGAYPLYNFYYHILPPNYPSWTIDYVNGPDLLWDKEFKACVSASSYHTGHVNVLMADGRVSSVDERISPSVWLAYGTPNGDENVPFLGE